MAKTAEESELRELPWLSDEELRRQRRLRKIGSFAALFVPWYACGVFVVFVSGGPPNFFPGWLFWAIVLPALCIAFEIVGALLIGVLALPFALIMEIPIFKNTWAWIKGTTPIRQLLNWITAADRKGLLVYVFAAVAFGLLGILLWVLPSGY